MEKMNLSTVDKAKISYRYFSEGLKELYASLVLDKIDRFFISKAVTHAESYKTRGNVVQRVNGLFTNAHYDALLSEGISGIEMMQAELNK
jgi:uncharacterized protein YqgQ